MNKQYCLTLELHNDDELIRLYDVYHQVGNVWPEVIKSIRDSGIEQMTIYRQDTRLMMILDVDDSFSFEKKSKSDLSNKRVQEWELLMEKFQKIEQGNSSRSKWKLVDKIFSLDEH